MCDKIPLSKRQAATVVSQARKRHGCRNPNKTIPKRVYYCSECKAYHTTLKPNYTKPKFHDLN